MKTLSYPVLLSVDFKPIMDYLEHEAWLQNVVLMETRPLHAIIIPKKNLKYEIGNSQFILTKVKYKYQWLYCLKKVFELPY